MGSVTTYKGLNMDNTTEYFSMSDIEYYILNGDIKGASEYIKDWGRDTDSNVIRHFEHYVKKYYTYQYKIDK